MKLTGQTPQGTLISPGEVNKGCTDLYKLFPSLDNVFSTFPSYIKVFKIISRSSTDNFT